ncbi:hypothetical protein ACFFX0_26515 [Citricoccus parietis]|uniref:Uncharacterized protein n=1 Tax=Citricoccus parietis TaxID=592307 RepID=A0ABV5G6H5_9MICC
MPDTEVLRRDAVRRGLKRRRTRVPAGQCTASGAQRGRVVCRGIDATVLQDQLPICGSGNADVQLCRFHRGPGSHVPVGRTPHL